MPSFSDPFAVLLPLREAQEPGGVVDVALPWDPQQQTQRTQRTGGRRALSISWKYDVFRRNPEILCGPPVLCVLGVCCRGSVCSVTPDSDAIV
jgi:hypothetical protein